MGKFNLYDEELWWTNEMLRWGQAMSQVEDKREKLWTLRLRMDEERTSQFWLWNGTSYQQFSFVSKSQKVIHIPSFLHLHCLLIFIIIIIHIIYICKTTNLTRYQYGNSFALLLNNQRFQLMEPVSFHG